MLNPLPTLGRYALDRLLALNPFRGMFYVNRAPNAVRIDIRPLRREDALGHWRAITLIGNDTELCIAHTPPGEYYSDEVSIRHPHSRTEPIPRWPDDPLFERPVGPLSIAVNTAAYQRKLHAEWVAKRAAREAASSATA